MSFLIIEKLKKFTFLEIKNVKNLYLRLEKRKIYFEMNLTIILILVIIGLVIIISCLKITDKPIIPLYVENPKIIEKPIEKKDYKHLRNDATEKERKYLGDYALMETEMVPIKRGGLKETNDRYAYYPESYPENRYPTVGRSPYESNIPFGNVDLPFEPVTTQWDKIGLLTNNHNKELLDLYRRPIAPNQEMWEYYVIDKNGFEIPLKQTQYINDGDEIFHIIGKEGSWKANIFVNNRWIWF